MSCLFLPPTDLFFKLVVSGYTILIMLNCAAQWNETHLHCGLFTFKFQHVSKSQLCMSWPVAPALLRKEQAPSRSMCCTLLQSLFLAYSPVLYTLRVWKSSSALKVDWLTWLHIEVCAENHFLPEIWRPCSVVLHWLLWHPILFLWGLFYISGNL